MSDIEERVVIEDASDLRRYRTEIPNMADDEMDPYQYRLYGHYKRIGECWESTRTTARMTGMSIGKVVETRNWLAQNRWIELAQHTSGSILVRIVDRWLENFTRYSKLPLKKENSHRPSTISVPLRDEINY